MRFKTQPSPDLTHWHRATVWWPTRVNPKLVIWLESVWRRRVYYRDGDYLWEYIPGDSTMRFDGHAWWPVFDTKSSWEDPLEQRRQREKREQAC